jgi:hypothetical protein
VPIELVSSKGFMMSHTCWLTWKSSRPPTIRYEACRVLNSRLARPTPRLDRASRSTVPDSSSFTGAL